jgi:O-antigen/teichoic acid export membrane protein
MLNLFRFAHARRGHIVRTLAEDSRRSFWAMADQGIVSAGNFAIGLYLARFFDQHHHVNALGDFGVVMGVVFFLRGVHAALVVYPLSVRGAVVDSMQLSVLATSAIWTTVISWPVQGALVIGAALLWKIGLPVGLWAACAMLVWQIQETLRRALMTHLRFRAAMLGDAIAYLGPFGAIVFIARHGDLPLWTIFATMALWSFVAALLQAAQVRLCRHAWSDVLDFPVQSWRLGRWVLLGSSISTLCTHTLFEWNMAFWLGTQQFGIFYALVSMVRLANPLAFAVASMVVPNAARTRREQGMHRAKRVMQRFTLLGALFLVPYLGLLLLSPRLSIMLFYGKGSEYLNYALVLRVLAGTIALSYLSICVAAFLNAVEHSRYSFIAQLYSATAFVVIAMPLTAIFGIAGAALGWLISQVTDVLANTYFVTRLTEDKRELPVELGAALTASFPAPRAS